MTVAAQNRGEHTGVMSTRPAMISRAASGLPW
jgi:hypothetical protein